MTRAGSIRARDRPRGWRGRGRVRPRGRDRRSERALLQRPNRREDVLLWGATARRRSCPAAGDSDERRLRGRWGLSEPGRALERAVVIRWAQRRRQAVGRDPERREPCSRDPPGRPGERRDRPRRARGEVSPVDASPRIECYDVSNLQGTLAVPVATFADGSRSRRTTVTASVTPRRGHYACMREVLDRRLRQIETEPLPDLLMVDGGRAGRRRDGSPRGPARGRILGLGNRTTSPACKARRRTQGRTPLQARARGAIQPRRAFAACPASADPRRVTPLAIEFNAAPEPRSISSILEELPGIGPTAKSTAQGAPAASRAQCEPRGAGVGGCRGMQSRSDVFRCADGARGEPKARGARIILPLDCRRRARTALRLLWAVGEAGRARHRTIIDERGMRPAPCARGAPSRRRSPRRAGPIITEVERQLDVLEERRTGAPG